MPLFIRTSVTSVNGDGGRKEDVCRSRQFLLEWREKAWIMIKEQRSADWTRWRQWTLGLPVLYLHLACVKVVLWRQRSWFIASVAVWRSTRIAAESPRTNTAADARRIVNFRLSPRSLWEESRFRHSRAAGWIQTTGDDGPEIRYDDVLIVTGGGGLIRLDA